MSLDRDDTESVDAMGNGVIGFGFGQLVREGVLKPGSADIQGQPDHRRVTTLGGGAGGLVCVCVWCV